MISDEIIPILEGLDEYNMTEVSFQITACHPSSAQIGQDCLLSALTLNLFSFIFIHHPR